MRGAVKHPSGCGEGEREFRELILPPRVESLPLALLRKRTGEDMRSIPTTPKARTRGRARLDCARAFLFSFFFFLGD